MLVGTLVYALQVHLRA